MSFSCSFSWATTADSLSFCLLFLTGKSLSLVAEGSICCKMPRTVSNAKALCRKGGNEPRPSRTQRPERQCHYNYKETPHRSVTGADRWVMQFHRGIEAVLPVHHCPTQTVPAQTARGPTFPFRTGQPGPLPEWHRPWQKAQNQTVAQTGPR